MAHVIPEDTAAWLAEILSPIIEEYELPTYRHLVGAGLSLQESVALLVRSDLALAVHEERLLQSPDFLAYLGATQDVRWKRDKRMRLYGCEFYLNKAQTNIAASLDRLVNEWIEDKAPLPYKAEERFLRSDFYYLMPSSRLRIVSMLRNLRAKTEADIPSETRTLMWQLESDWSRFEQLYDDQGAARLLEANLQAVNNLVAEGKFSEAYRNPNAIRCTRLGVPDTLLQGSDCLAVVLGRFNAFKHLHKGLHNRSRGLHYVEWVVTARALQYIVLLARELFRED